MRIHLRTTANTQTIPFNYQQKLVGTIHKWLGKNELHDIMSLYSFSWLHNGKQVEKGFNFTDGAYWFISFYDDAKLKIIIDKIRRTPELFNGMRITDISIEETPDFNSKEIFSLGSPIFLKRFFPGNLKDKHYTFEDPESNDLMKETLLHKMQKAGLPSDETLEIGFDLTYEKKKIKYINYHNIRNKASLCPIYIKGKPETKAFAWNVGIGNSTGIGFGAIY